MIKMLYKYKYDIVKCPYPIEGNPTTNVTVIDNGLTPGSEINNPFKKYTFSGNGVSVIGAQIKMQITTTGGLDYQRNLTIPAGGSIPATLQAHMIEFEGFVDFFGHTINFTMGLNNGYEVLFTSNTAANPDCIVTWTITQYVNPTNLADYAILQFEADTKFMINKIMNVKSNGSESHTAYAFQLKNHAGETSTKHWSSENLDLSLFNGAVDMACFMNPAGLYTINFLTMSYNELLLFNEWHVHIIKQL